MYALVYIGRTGRGWKMRQVVTGCYEEPECNFSRGRHRLSPQVYLESSWRAKLGTNTVLARVASLKTTGLFSTRFHG